MTKQQGFTLIELLITIVIIGILASVAYPAYTNQVYDGRRSDGRLALLDAVQKMERCKTTNYTYVGCNAFTSGSESAEKYYKLTSENVTATSYRLLATPQNAQAKDTQCNVLSIDEKNTRSADGTDPNNCW